jgi:hypothetical protein
MILFAECGLRNAGSKSRFRLRLSRFSIVIISIGEKNRAGGLARRGAWGKDLRESEKGILVSDAGDLLFKKYLHPIPENELTAMAGKTHLIIESFNLMGYDAMGIGDDDLTLGKEFLLEISRKANFPFLCSNLLDETSGKNLFQTSLIKEINQCHLGWPHRDQSPLSSRHQKHHYKDCRQKLRSGIRRRLFLFSLPDLIFRRNLFQPSPYSAWVV